MKKIKINCDFGEPDNIELKIKEDRLVISCEEDAGLCTVELEDHSVEKLIKFLIKNYGISKTGVVLYGK